MARFVFILIGALLAFTASAKLWMLLIDPFVGLKIGLRKEILFYIICIEYLVAYLNFRRTSIAVVMATNLVLFGVFLCYSIFLWVIGTRSCGCYGIVEVPIHFTVVFNFGIVILLVAHLFNTIGLAAFHANVICFGRSFSAKSVLLFFCVGALVVSVTAINYWLRLNKGVTAQPVNIGQISVGGSSEFKVRIDNKSRFKATIMGLRTSCSCLALNGIGSEIASNGTGSIIGHFTARKEGQFK